MCVNSIIYDLKTTYLGQKYKKRAYFLIFGRKFNQKSCEYAKNIYFWGVNISHKRI